MVVAGTRSQEYLRCCVYSDVLHHHQSTDNGNIQLLLAEPLFSPNLPFPEDMAFAIVSEAIKGPILGMVQSIVEEQTRTIQHIADTCIRVSANATTEMISRVEQELYTMQQLHDHEMVQLRSTLNNLVEDSNDNFYLVQEQLNDDQQIHRPAKRQQRLLSGGLRRREKMR